ncbi:hypothetical protein [Brevundimonas sp. DC300-4]|uniref:hypothetical protein n=1 Tax=Brevundimonas sp. DC300-4 TaxID=2804594 RepID=UPI003CF69D16
MTVGAIVGGAVLIATGVGALAGLNVAAMGISTLTGSLTVGQLGTLASGLAAVGSALDKPKSSGSGNPGDWTSNPDQPTPFLFGRMGVAGKIVHRDEFGPDDNMYQGIVGVLSGAGPIKSILGFKGDDQPVTFDGSGKANASQWTGEMWMRYRMGDQPDTALVSPSGLKSGATLPEWGSAHKLSGKASYLQVLGENSKRTAYPNGEPVPQHLCEGIYGWDGRYDDTWPGGMGDCRLGNRSTYRYITDPIIAGLNWALGLVENGKIVGGIGASIDGVDVDSFLQAANVSEANGWTISAWPDTSEDVSVVLDQMLQAGGASRARHSGRISCVTRGAVLPSVVTVTEADLAGPIELDTGATLFNRLTTITPKFMSEAAGWQPVAGSPVSFPSLIEEDGVETGDQIDYRFVPVAKQAAELAALDILDAREPFSGTVPLKPHMRRLKPGSRFTIDAPGLLLSGVKCIVLGRSYTAQTGEARISFRSETDGKVDLALGKTTTLPAFPNLRPADPTFVTAPTAAAWTITPRAAAIDGTQTPGFDVVGAVESATATGLLVEWSPAGADQWTAEGGIWPATTTGVPITGVQSGEDYDIGLSYVRGQNTSARTVFGPYTASQLVALSAGDAAALAILERIGSDNWLTKNEKPEVVRTYQALTADYNGLLAQALAQGVSSAAYNTAVVGTLNPYLDGLSPSLTDYTTDTPIVGTTFATRFRDAFVAREALRTAISAAIAVVAEQAAADADTALDALADIANDNILTRGEKPAVIRLWLAIDGEKVALQAQGVAGGAGAAAATTAYVAAYSDLGTYLASLSPGWSDTANDTPIVSATFNEAFEAYYVAKQALLNALIGVAGIDAQTALARLAIIDSDGYLSRGEKPEVERQYLVIYAEYPALSAQALAIGETTQRTALIAAYDALTSYLTGLTPAWNNPESDTPVTAGVLAARFSAYAGAKSAVQTALLAIVGADAADALDQIDDITSDNILSPGADKRVVIGQVGAINTEASSIAAQAAAVGVSSTAYTDAITALNAYLNGLSPVWSDVTQSTPISGTTLRSLFLACAGTRQSVLNAISAAIGADAAEARDRIAVIASDNQLSRGEKSEVIRQHQIINGEYPGLAAQALARGVSSTAYAAAINALNAYLDGLTPTWFDLNVDTPITGSTLRTLFVNCATARQALMTAIDAALATDIGIERDRLNRIASDNWLTADEKPQIVRDWTFLTSDYALLIAQAASFGVSSSAYSTAVGALNTYLAGLSPAWNDYTTDTVIVGSTFATKFTDADTARTALKVALTAAVGADGAAANARLLALAADNILAKEEKRPEIAKYAEYGAEYSGLIAAAATAGVTTERTTYINAYAALGTYLSGLSPSFSDQTLDTPIVGSTYVSKFSDYVAAKTALLSAMANAGGGSVVIIRQVPFFGFIGPTTSYPNTGIAVTEATAYPSGGRFYIEFSNAFMSSDASGVSPAARGIMRVVMYHPTGNVQVGAYVNPETASQDYLAFDTAGMAVALDNPGAGTVQFQLQCAGGSPNDGSPGSVNGTMKVTYVK